MSETKKNLAFSTRRWPLWKTNESRTLDTIISHLLSFSKSNFASPLGSRAQRVSFSLLFVLAFLSLFFFLKHLFLSPTARTLFHFRRRTCSHSHSLTFLSRLLLFYSVLTEEQSNGPSPPLSLSPLVESSLRIFFSSRSYARARFFRDQTPFVVSYETRETVSATFAGVKIHSTRQTIVRDASKNRRIFKTYRPMQFHDRLGIFHRIMIASAFGLKG